MAAATAGAAEPPIAEEDGVEAAPTTMMTAVAAGIAATLAGIDEITVITAMRATVAAATGTSRTRAADTRHAATRRADESTPATAAIPPAARSTVVPFAMLCRTAAPAPVAEPALATAVLPSVAALAAAMSAPAAAPAVAA